MLIGLVLGRKEFLGSGMLRGEGTVGGCGWRSRTYWCVVVFGDFPSAFVLDVLSVSCDGQCLAGMLTLLGELS